jgi:hypothetical protein
MAVIYIRFGDLGFLTVHVTLYHVVMKARSTCGWVVI